MKMKVKPEEYFLNHSRYDRIDKVVRKGMSFVENMFKYCDSYIEFNTYNIKLISYEKIDDFYWELWMFEGYDDNGNEVKKLQPEFEF